MDFEAINIVENYVMEHLDKSDPEPEFETYIVWKCKALQNWKYLISTSLFDGMYYELTYNGDKKEWYLDAYKKFENRCIPALEIVTCQMIQRKMKKGTVSAKVAITIEERADDKTGEIYYDMVLEPNVNMKIGSGESLKCGTKKAIMKQDNQGRPMIASAQIGMDELVDEGEQSERG